MRACMMLFVLLCVVGDAQAAVSGGFPIVTIHGVITPGDVVDFERAVNGYNNVVVELDSEGGDVTSALAIGRLIRNHGFSVAVKDGSTCASACVLLLASGVEKIVFEDAKVIVHRPYLSAELSDKSQYDRAYKHMLNVLGDYLSEMNVPRGLLDRMVSVPPQRGDLLSYAELTGYMLVGKDPAFAQEEAAREASIYGVPMHEQNRRKGISDRVCYWVPVTGKSWFFESISHATCDDLVMRGLSEKTVIELIRRVYTNRQHIEALEPEAQITCIKQAFSASPQSGCEIRLNE